MRPTGSMFPLRGYQPWGAYGRRPPWPGLPRGSALARNPIRGVTAAVPMISKGGHLAPWEQPVAFTEERRGVCRSPR